MTPLKRRRNAHGAWLPASARAAQREAGEQLLAALNARHGPGAAGLAYSLSLCSEREGGIAVWRLHIAVDLALPDNAMEMPDAAPQS